MFKQSLFKQFVGIFEYSEQQIRVQEVKIHKSTWFSSIFLHFTREVSLLLDYIVWGKRNIHEILRWCSCLIHCSILFLLSKAFFNIFRNITIYFQLEKCLIKVVFRKNLKKPNFYELLRLCWVLYLFKYNLYFCSRIF